MRMVVVHVPGGCSIAVAALQVGRWARQHPSVEHSVVRGAADGGAHVVLFVLGSGPEDDVTLTRSIAGLIRTLPECP